MPKKTAVAKNAVAVKSSPDKPPAAKPPAKPAPKDAGKTKTDFVLAQPKDMAAKDIVAAAKAQGFVLSEGYVYTIRSAARTKKGSKSSAAKKPAKRAAARRKSAPKKGVAKKPAAKKPSKNVVARKPRKKPVAKKAVAKKNRSAKTIALKAAKPTADAFAGLERLDLAYAVGRLVESGKTTAADVMQLAAERTSLISSLESELAALRGGLVPARGEAEARAVRPSKPLAAGKAGARKPGKGPRKVGTVMTRRDGRTFTTTQKVVTARKIQGQYMGYLRQFAGKDKDRFKAVARDKGVPAAIVELKKALGKS